MLDRRGADNLALMLEHLLAFEAVADRPVEQCALHSFVRALLPRANCLAKLLMDIAPPVDRGCVHAEEISKLVVRRTQRAQLCCLLCKLWPVVCRPSAFSHEIPALAWAWLGGFRADVTDLVHALALHDLVARLVKHACVDQFEIFENSSSEAIDRSAPPRILSPAFAGNSLALCAVMH